MPASSEDKVLDAVKRINTPWPDNKNYFVRQTADLSGGQLYTVGFTNKEGTEDYTNYAFARGGYIKAFYYLDDVIRDPRAAANRLWDAEFIRLISVVLIACILLVAVIAAAFSKDFAAERLTILVGLFGSFAGYLIGQKTTGKPSVDGS